MTKLTYAQQLAHPLWQRRRLEMLSRANWECDRCGDNEKQLHVHHQQYFKGRMAWEYSNDELKVLCKDCHERSHTVDDKIKAILCHIPPEEALALLAGYCNFELPSGDLEDIYRANSSIYDAGGVASCLREDRPALLSAIYSLIVEADGVGSEPHKGTVAS